MLTMDDTYRLEDFGLICEVGHEHPMTPNIERKTLAIPRRVGLWDFGTEIKERPFTFPLAVIEMDRKKLQLKLNNFVSLLFDPFGQPREIKIAFDYEPDKFYMVKCNAFITPDRLIHAARFTLSLVADDPMKYSTANQYDKNVNYGEVTEDDFYPNPTSFQWIYTKHYSGINNYSSLNTDFIIEIIGTVTNPKVTNLVSNETLTLPSIANGILEVKPRTFEIVKDGVSTLSGSNHNFFYIQPGEVGFLFEGENPNAIVSYKWLHKFM